MACFTTLYSGSSGNCAFLEEDGRFVLVDMGKSARATMRALTQLGAQAKRLTFTNKTVATSAWASDTTYADFPFRAAVPCTGMTESMFVQVVLAPEDATGGNFAPVCRSYTGGVYLYAKAAPDAEITIPTIVAWG